MRSVYILVKNVIFFLDDFLNKSGKLLGSVSEVAFGTGEMGVGDDILPTFTLHFLLVSLLFTKTAFAFKQVIILQKQSSVHLVI